MTNIDKLFDELLIKYKSLGFQGAIERATKDMEDTLNKEVIILIDRNNKENISKPSEKEVSSQ